MDVGLRSNNAGREAFGPGDYNALCFGRTSFWILFLFFFGVFTYLKNDQKELTAKLSSRYCSVRITKANAITRRIGGGGEEGTFLESSLPPGGDPLDRTCGSGVPDVLPGTAHTF